MHCAVICTTATPRRDSTRGFSTFVGSLFCWCFNTCRIKVFLNLSKTSNHHPSSHVPVPKHTHTRTQTDRQTDRQTDTHTQHAKTRTHKQNTSSHPHANAPTLTHTHTHTHRCLIERKPYTPCATRRSTPALFVVGSDSACLAVACRPLQRSNAN